MNIHNQETQARSPSAPAPSQAKVLLGPLCCFGGCPGKSGWGCLQSWLSVSLLSGACLHPKLVQGHLYPQRCRQHPPSGTTLVHLGKG